MEQDTVAQATPRPVPRPPAGDGDDPLTELDTVLERPLAEQVGVYEAVHERLSARLSSAED